MTISISGFYRSALTKRILLSLEMFGSDNTASNGATGKETEQESKKINVLDAVHLMAQAWKDVKPQTVSNCFKKAFSLPKDETRAADTMEDLNILGDVPVPANMDYEEFVALVEEDVVLGEITEDFDEDEEDEKEDEKEAEEQKEAKVDLKDCVKALFTVRAFCEQQGKAPPSVHDSLRWIEHECVILSSEKAKQKRITDFFKA